MGSVSSITRHDCAVKAAIYLKSVTHYCAEIKDPSARLTKDSEKSVLHFHFAYVTLQHGGLISTHLSREQQLRSMYGSDSIPRITQYNNNGLYLCSCLLTNSLQSAKTLK